MTSRSGLGIVMMLVVAVHSGCTQDQDTAGVLEASAHPYVADLPLPVDFKIIERQSEERARAGYRDVHHVYQGKGDLQAVRNFYQHHMEQANWELVDHTGQKGVYVRRYKKGREKCEIRIERMPSGLFGTVTQIRAKIRPEALEKPDRNSD